ncbi:hypothetical protein WME89_05915 [Sorangium sp. So ce321]|uniref:tetratricopeptide repeat protein n=1 Tax=Sorangium sp. So ce321 TaxID=3133300 RepID=UPI003F5E6228
MLSNTALRRATSACDGFYWPRKYVRIGWFLGQALEQTGDTPGACAAYQSVIDRWGDAKPQSVTADSARARMKAIGCALLKRSSPSH